MGVVMRSILVVWLVLFCFSPCVALAGEPPPAANSGAAPEAQAPSRMERALDRARREEVGRAQPTTTLEWDAFVARFFPSRPRHDLEALRAYVVHRAGEERRGLTGRGPTAG